MTTIGKAVLQVIPSLQGVSEEIDKQTEGKVITIPVEPKVDKSATTKAGKDAGDTITKEVKEAVRKGDIGTALGDSVRTSARSGGGLRKSASDAAGEFGKGFIEGITGELRNARIGNVLEGINTQVRTTTSLIRGIGGVTGIDVSPIVSASDTISGAIGEIQTAASNTKTQVDSVITPLQQFGELAGPDSKLYKATGKLPIIGQFIELIPAMREGNAQLEGIVAKYTGLNVPLSGESWVRWLTDNGRAFSSAEDNARQKLADAQAAAAANGAPTQRGAAFPGDTYRGPGRYTGGMIPGFSTKDDRIGLVGGRGLIGLAGGEGIINAPATRRLGGKRFIDALNGFKDGGVVGNAESLAASLDGLPYIYGSRDCSKVQSDIYAALTGKPTGPRYFTTESDFEALGFIPGSAPGAYNIGVRRGGGGKLSHMAGTLPNGVNFEAGGADSTVKYGGSATGAADFPLKFYLPVTGGDPSGGGGGGGSRPSASVASAKPFVNVGGGGGSSSSGGGSSSISVPSSIPDLASFGLGDLGKGVGTTGSGSDLSLFGNAAGAAVSGQVQSALDVFGIPGAPGWLKGISQFVGGISIGGGGGSAGPLAAKGKPFANAGAAENMHGGHAGQQPGIGVQYNIQARDTEDAFIKAQRKEREKSAAKLDRF